MASNEDIIKEAEYYLANDVNIDEASKALGVSRRTFQLHMKKLEQIAPEKAKLVTDKKKNNIRQGNIKGGTLGRKSSSWDELNAMEIADYLITNEMTYEQVEKELGVPKSTLHDVTHSVLKDEKKTSLLYALALAHKRGLNLAEFIKQYNSEHVTSDMVAKDILDKKVEQNSNKSK